MGSATTAHHHKVVVLINLGTPASTKISDVRRYLYEFLMDPAVIDLPYWGRLALVGGIITPFRAFASRKAYRTIWTEAGSPLLVLSKDLQAKLQAQTPTPIFLAMRYGKPSIESVLMDALSSLAPNGTLQIIPLYPHHAMSTTLTVFQKVRSTLKKLQSSHTHSFTTQITPPFYNHPTYLKALTASIKPYTKTLGQPTGNYDAILFSYHGTPIRHLQKVDHNNHCMMQAACCSTSQPQAHAICYRHQVLATTAAVVKTLNLPADRVFTSFQSRLGKNWLTPYTDEVIKSFPSQGIQNLLVVTPAFVSDNLETLFEIAIENKEFFEAAGGETLTLIPCLNTTQPWIDCLLTLIEETADFTPALTQASETLAAHSSLNNHARHTHHHKFCTVQVGSLLFKIMDNNGF